MFLPLFTTFLLSKSKPLHLWPRQDPLLPWQFRFHSHHLSLMHPLEQDIESGAETPMNGEWWMWVVPPWVVGTVALTWSNLLKMQINHDNTPLKFFQWLPFLFNFKIINLDYKFSHNLALSPSFSCLWHTIFHSLNSLNSPYPPGGAFAFLLPGNKSLWLVT